MAIKNCKKEKKRDICLFPNHDFRWQNQCVYQTQLFNKITHKNKPIKICFELKNNWDYIAPASNTGFGSQHLILSPLCQGFSSALCNLQQTALRQIIFLLSVFPATGSRNKQMSSCSTRKTGNFHINPLLNDASNLFYF